MFTWFRWVRVEIWVMVVQQVGMMAEVEIHFSSMQLPYAEKVAKAILVAHL
jgi:hypothetical protein